MKEENKCVMGCKNYHGGEIKHHKDCPFYPESFTERYEQMEIELANVRGLAEKEQNEKEILEFVKYFSGKVPSMPIDRLGKHLQGDKRVQEIYLKAS